jgi:rubredoxin
VAISRHNTNKARRQNSAFVVVKPLEKWECLVCGYIYDPQVGDLEHGIPAGTSFENLPENWVCPVCGAPKDQFVKKA